MMIAIPLPIVIERDDEQVGTFEILQRGLSGNGRIEYHGLTQGAAQAIEEGSAQQESLDAFGLLLQDFFNQIIQHKMVAARERLDETGGILMALHGDRGQL